MGPTRIGFGLIRCEAKFPSSSDFPLFLSLGASRYATAESPELHSLYVVAGPLGVGSGTTVLLVAQRSTFSFTSHLNLS